MSTEVSRHSANFSRPPHGGRGLKCPLPGASAVFPGRPPHGGRGLKSLGCRRQRLRPAGRPPHGGRGLKSLSSMLLITSFMSPSPRRAWIEIAVLSSGCGALASPSPRRAWIEIVSWSGGTVTKVVALPTEGVD